VIFLSQEMNTQSFMI